MKKVLLVDDEDCIEAVVARTGLDGVEKYREHNPDCVFLDINLPDIKGIEVFKRIKAFAPSPVVYFITGEVGSIELSEAFALGARDYLLKPVDMFRLKEIIESSDKAPDPIS
jgi:CheY-like chemotaxis protein